LPKHFLLLFQSQLVAQARCRETFHVLLARDALIHENHYIAIGNWKLTSVCLQYYSELAVTGRAGPFMGRSLVNVHKRMPSIDQEWQDIIVVLKKIASHVERKVRSLTVVIMYWL
jgi:hypothetical protein